MAERLIDTYGSSGRALASSHESLARTLQGHAPLADVITAARDLADYSSLALIRSEPIDVADPGFLEYLRRELGGQDDERLLGIFVDASSRFISSGWLATGLGAQVTVPCRAVTRRVIELGAEGIVLAHNHPSGSTKPSAADIRSTAILRTVLTALGCRLLDHLIVGRDGCFSMARAGLA